jgi:DNA-binding protein YbaB
MADNNLETAKLLKDALKIVDELARIDFDDMGMSEEDNEHLEALIKRAKTLKKHRLWKL